MLAAFPAMAQRGPHSGDRFTVAGMNITVVYRTAEAAAHRDEVQQVLGGGLRRYEALFGGLPRRPGGFFTREIVVDIGSSELGEGDADPGIIRLTIGRRPYFGFYDWRLTLLHEAFHLWNAESFRYASGAEQWFNEGASEFYALQTASLLGLIPPDRVLSIAGTVAGFYASARGLGRYSLREAGETPERKRDHYFLVYHGGWLAVLVLDHDLRRRSGNLQSLDDVMRRLYRLHDARDRLYDVADLEEAMRLTSGGDYQAFFNRYIRGREQMPYAHRFDLGAHAMALSAQLTGLRPRVELDEYLLASFGIRLQQR